MNPFVKRTLGVATSFANGLVDTNLLLEEEESSTLGNRYIGKEMGYNGNYLIEFKSCVYLHVFPFLLMGLKVFIT